MAESPCSLPMTSNHGRAHTVLQQREQTLRVARNHHPERFVRGIPKPLAAFRGGLDQPTCYIDNRRDCSVNRNRRVESGTGAPTVGSGGGSVAFASGLSPAPMVTFPVPAHRTVRADFPHTALGRDHAFAHGKLTVRGAR